MHELPAGRPLIWSSLVCTAALSSRFVRPRNCKPRTGPKERTDGLHNLTCYLSLTAAQQQLPAANLGPRAEWLRVRNHTLLHSGSHSGSAAQTPHPQHASPHSPACGAGPKPAGLQLHKCRSTRSDRLPCLQTVWHSISSVSPTFVLWCYQSSKLLTRNMMPEEVDYTVRGLPGQVTATS